MYRKMRALSVLLAVMTVGMGAWAFQAPEVVRTVWDGVYTDAQARRGQGFYETHCSACHGDDLSGRNAAALRGDRFMERWREDTLNSLYTVMKNSMPPSAPSSLGDVTYADIVTYILHMNEFPAGSEELKPEAIPDIRVEGRDGPAAVPDFSLVEVVGCLAQGPGNAWILTDASEPMRIRSPGAPTDAELQASAARPLGEHSITLLYLGFFRSGFSPDAHVGHKMQAKGLLIRDPDLRLNVSWLEMADSACVP